MFNNVGTYNNPGEDNVSMARALITLFRAEVSTMPKQEMYVLVPPPRTRKDKRKTGRRHGHRGLAAATALASVSGGADVDDPRPWQNSLRSAESPLPPGGRMHANGNVTTTPNCVLNAS